MVSITADEFCLGSSDDSDLCQNFINVLEKGRLTLILGPTKNSVCKVYVRNMPLVIMECYSYEASGHYTMVNLVSIV